MKKAIVVDDDGNSHDCMVENRFKVGDEGLFTALNLDLVEGMIVWVEKND